MPPRPRFVSYSSASSTSGLSLCSPSSLQHPLELLACGEESGQPPTFAGLFRTHSLQSNHAYSSPDEAEPEDESPEFASRRSSRMEAADDDEIEPEEAIEPKSDGRARTLRGSASQRRLQSSMSHDAAFPDPIDEEAPPPPSVASLYISRTRSLPLPSAVSANSAPHSSLPGSQPGFGSSTSWTPGLPPPAPYVQVSPVPAVAAEPHPLEQAEADAAVFGDGHALIGAPLVDLPPPLYPAQHFAGDEDPHADPLLHAPPPTRAPSLMRQNGVYDESTSRSLSVPHDSRERFRQRVQRERQREAEQRARADHHLLPPPSIPSHFLHNGDADLDAIYAAGSEPDSGAETDSAAESNELPPL